MNTQGNSEPDNEPVRSTRRNADQAMAESCPNPDSFRRTRLGRAYSAPERPANQQRNTPTLRPRPPRSVQFDVNVEVGEAATPQEVPGTDPRSHHTQLEPRDMTLTLVGNQGEPPQPVSTSTPAESVNLETIHQDVYSVLRSLQTLTDDIETGRFIERPDVLNELRRPQTPEEENKNEVIDNPVKLESKPHVPESVPVNPSGHFTPVEVKPLEGTKNESSPSNHGGTDT